ncbi:hypothetical protein [Neisseria musculi]|uniref:hypothetical protein n=1 Tax=Neisseria musculi TaxID=1815583 RepID=UPI00361A274B
MLQHCRYLSGCICSKTNRKHNTANPRCRQAKPYRHYRADPVAAWAGDPQIVPFALEHGNDRPNHTGLHMAD